MPAFQFNGSIKIHLIDADHGIRQHIGKAREILLIERQRPVARGSDPQHDVAFLVLKVMPVAVEIILVEAHILAEAGRIEHP